MGQSFTKRREDFLEFAKNYQIYEQNRSFSEFQQHSLWFLKDFINLGNLKDKVTEATEFDEVIQIIETFDAKSVFHADKIYKKH